MNVTEIVMVIGGSFTIVGAIVTVVWVISNRPTYKYCDETYQRKDLHDEKYNTLIEKIEELKESIDDLKESK